MCLLTSTNIFFLTEHFRRLCSSSKICPNGSGMATEHNRKLLSRHPLFPHVQLCRRLSSVKVFKDMFSFLIKVFIAEVDGFVELGFRELRFPDGMGTCSTTRVSTIPGTDLTKQAHVAASQKLVGWYVAHVFNCRFGFNLTTSTLLP